MRSAMHQTGSGGANRTAASLIRRAQYGDGCCPARAATPSRYVGLRSKAVLTAVGEARLPAPVLSCATTADRGQFPVDVELDVENTEFSPGVRRMLAMVGQQAAFDQGRQQMELLAGLSVTTKAVERTAEAIGADIETRQQRELAQALQLTLPIPLGIPHSSSSMWRWTARAFPSCARKPRDVRGNRTASPPTRGKPSWAACSRRLTVNQEGYPLRDEDSTTYVGAIESSRAIRPSPVRRSLASGDGAARRKRLFWETARNGSGIRPICISPTPRTSSISIMPGNTYGTGSWPTLSPRCAGPEALE